MGLSMDLRLPLKLIQRFETVPTQLTFGRSHKRGFTMTKVFSRFLSACLFAMLVVGFSASRANAQDNASVTGVVTDPTGAVVAQVKVTLANPSIGFSVRKATNAKGLFEFSNVPPASGYSLEFSAS